MKLALLFLLLTSFAKAQDVDVLHYQFSIYLTDNNDTIAASTQVTFRLGKTNVLALDLQGAKAGKGMTAQLAISVGANSERLALRQEETQVVISLPPGKAGDIQTIKVFYRGVPNDGLIISKNKYGDRTFFADNWPNRAHHWLACIDKPDDKASFEFLVTTPPHYQVVSNGTKVEERLDNEASKLTHWKEDIPSPTKVMVISVAKFATKVFADSPKDIPVSAWVYPQDSAKGFYDYALTTDILKFFSNYIGPYPYKKLANVQSKTIFGGMENANCIFYAESSVTGDRSEEDLYAHEIAHQWFGDMASEKSFAHLWLSEGFATYLTDIYFERKYGREPFVKRLAKQRDEVMAFAKTSTHPVVDTTSNLMSLLNANSYQKGAWVLHMLRSEVGDSSFRQIIQTYYNTYKGSNADTKDFEAVAEKVSGRELTWFFDQWLYWPGVPRLETKMIERNGESFFSIVQQQPELFKLNVDVAVISRFNKSMQIRTVTLTQKETLVPIQKGGRASLDPWTKLLFDGIAHPLFPK